MTGLGRLAAQFDRFAAVEADGHSPLYARLARAVADDPALLALAALAPPEQPTPNLLLAAVHHLLLEGADHPLRRFYPSAGGDDDGDPAAAFGDFCRDHADAIAGLLATRRVQTNEVRRCALLVPAIGVAWARLDRQPLALIEVGAAAGLNLFWDRYGYDYGSAGRWGDSASQVQIACDPRGTRPPLPPSVPPVVWRAGIDINPIDVRDAAETRWLRALVWPDQPERAERLERAVELARSDPPCLLPGDALDVLPSLLRAVPPDASLCVYHSFTLNQFTPEARERFAGLLAAAKAQRPLAEVAIGGSAPPSVSGFQPEIRLDGELLARGDPHGSWIDWLAE